MPEKRAGGIGEKEGSEESGKAALYSRKGGFLFSERWLREIGKLAFFDRIMQRPNIEFSCRSVQSYNLTILKS
jgi:hypothetical protein